MGTRVRVSEEKAKAQSECRHHWLIEAPSGPTSRGVCKHCGAQREFVNSIPELRWDSEIPRFNRRRAPVEEEVEEELQQEAL